MGLLRRRDRANADDWTPVELHIVSARRPKYNDLGDIPHWWEDVIEALSGTDYEFVLDVHRPDGRTHRIDHREKVPRSAASPGLSTEQKIPAGIDLPGWMRVDDPQKVAIDWSNYGSTAEAKGAIADARHIEADLNYAQHVLAKQKPKKQEQLRANAWSLTTTLGAAVRDGSFTRDVWEREAQSNMRKTLITPEQYAEARAIFEP